MSMIKNVHVEYSPAIYNSQLLKHVLNAYGSKETKIEEEESPRLVKRGTSDSFLMKEMDGLYIQYHD